jgi:putative endopeptidase
MKRACLLAFVSSATLAFAACGSPPEAATPVAPLTSLASTITAPGAVASASAKAADGRAVVIEGLAAEEERALDRSVSPCADFYQFACGSWVKETKIPDDESGWGRGFSTIRERNEAILHGLLEEAAKDKTSLHGSMYASCMDEKSVEAAATKPLAAEFDKIAKLASARDVARYIGRAHLRGDAPFFALSSTQDFADSTKVIGLIEQAGLGMPDRDYYLVADGKFPELRKKYEAHVAAMLTLVGEKDAPALAARIVAFESAIAKLHVSKEERREPKKNYHLIAREALSKEITDFAWTSYQTELPLKNAKEINVAQLATIKGVAALIRDPNSLADIKLYLKWNYLRSNASLLSKAFVDEAFVLEQALRGTKSQPPRWKRCVRATDLTVGESLAQAFVAKTLGDSGKQNVQRMITLIEERMQDNLKKTTWMDSATQALALEKLKAIANKIAFPDKWRSYQGLTLREGKYFDNATSASTFEVRRQLAKIGRPLDRTEWYMTPPTVNAYYDPSMNEMVFPAGILQPPFYGNTLSKAANFGAIGMVMGHELTHGFDDEGRQFDAKGNLRDWWTPAVNTEFEKRASCVEKQFAEYKVFELSLNGKLTLGENIADLGGIKLAFAAMRAELGSAPADARKFFLGYAQSWCTKQREETMRLRVTTDPHSPPMYRVNGPLANLPEFSEAFSCKVGDRMVRANRCEVW